MSYSAEVLADSPLDYFRLGESSGTTAVNAGTGGHGNGTYVGSPTLGAAGLLSGDANTSVDLSGSGQYVETADATPLYTAITVEAVIRPDSVAGGRDIVGRRYNGNALNECWQFRVLDGGKLDLFFVAGGTYYTSYQSASSLSAGQTYHVAATWDGSNVRLYINGVLDGTHAHTAIPNNGSTKLRIGWSAFGSPFEEYWDGRIDEVAVYGTALSGARITAHYDASVAATPVTLSASLSAKTASFAIAAVTAVTLNATLPAKVAAFEIEATPPPSSDITLSATLPPKTASFAVEPVGHVSLAATLLAKTAAFDVLAVPPPGEMYLSATLAAKTAAFTLEKSTVAGTVELAAMLPQKIATFAVKGITPVTPAPFPAETGQAVVVGRALGPVTMDGTQPVYTVSAASIPRARQQIVVNGVDVTYFRGVRTPDVTYTLLEPLLYGPGQLDLPQIAACFENEGEGDLSWLRAQAPVEVNLVVDDVVVVEGVYKGFVAAFDKSGRELSVELGGEANGRAAMRDRQVPIFPRINDIGHQIADAVRDLGLPHYPPLGAVTGIETMTTGGTGHLDHINDLVAKSWTRSGKQWSVMPDPATGVYETHRKDATTIHATAFLDDARTVGTLRRDIAEEPNQIFVTCVTPAGMRVRFGKYPGLVQGPVPDFPGFMEEGDTGEGVRLLIGKLHASGYLKLSEVAGGYDEDVTEAVKALQDDAGLTQTGDVNLATWEALYDLNVTGLSLEWANIQPAAQRSKTRKYDRSANGTIMGFNDEYDPEVIVRHRTIDLGSGVTRSQAREFARTVLHDSDDPNWVGDIKFHTGALLAGEHAIGATITEADVMDARTLRPGMNIWLPAFDGGTVVHVSACQVDVEGIVTATVDTRFRDAMEVWEVIARNAESRNDPSRHRARRYRASTIAKDSIGEWDEFGGYLGVDIPLERGWTVFPVVAAMEGQIRKMRVQLDTPAEFAVAVFGKKVDAGWLDDIIPNPLTVTGTRDWEKKEDQLDDKWMLFSYGTHDEPAGYWPGRKTWKSITGEEANPDYDPGTDENETGTDDDETITVTTSESTGTLTGKFVDAAGFPYFAEDRKVIWVALWVRGTNKIETGRIMWPQLEAGV